MAIRFLNTSPTSEINKMHPPQAKRHTVGGYSGRPFIPYQKKSTPLESRQCTQISSSESVNYHAKIQEIFNKIIDYLAGAMEDYLKI